MGNLADTKLYDSTQFFRFGSSIYDFSFMDVDKILPFSSTLGCHSSWFERMISHIGIETWPRLLWEAAVGIFRNGRKLDRAMLRGVRRPTSRELLFSEKKQWRYLENKHRLTLCQQP